MSKSARETYAVVGDGGLAMQLGEFSTAVRHRLPLKILVICNGMLNQIAWEQMMFLGHPQFACELAPIDFASAADAMGGTGFTITEAAIDAMSLAAFEGMREGSLYLSTGGGWSPATEAAVRVLAARPGTELVAATDANAQGEAFAVRLRDIAEDAGCDWFRLTPPAEDWNDALQEKTTEEKEKRESRRGLPHARRPRQG